MPRGNLPADFDRCESKRLFRGGTVTGQQGTIIPSREVPDSKPKIWPPEGLSADPRTQPSQWKRVAPRRSSLVTGSGSGWDRAHKTYLFDQLAGGFDVSLGLSLFLNAFEDELQKPFNPFANSGIFRLSISRNVQALESRNSPAAPIVSRALFTAPINVGKEINCETRSLENRLEDGVVAVAPLFVGVFSGMGNHLYLLLELDPFVAQVSDDDGPVRCKRRMFPPRAAISRSRHTMPVIEHCPLLPA